MEIHTHTHAHTDSETIVWFTPHISLTVSAGPRLGANPDLSPT